MVSANHSSADSNIYGKHYTCTLTNGASPSARGLAMDKTVAHLNIDHYRRLLEKETDEQRRQTLLRLLAEEQAKVADNPPTDRKRR